MAERHEEIRKILHREDLEFRNWSEEHLRYEDRLVELAGKPVLSPEEEVEEKTLKKKKLHLKDQMADRIRNYQVANAN